MIGVCAAGMDSAFAGTRVANHSGALTSARHRRSFPGGAGGRGDPGDSQPHAEAGDRGHDGEPARTADRAGRRTPTRTGHRSAVGIASVAHWRDPEDYSSVLMLGTVMPRGAIQRFLRSVSSVSVGGSCPVWAASGMAVPSWMTSRMMDPRSAVVTRLSAWPGEVSIQCWSTARSKRWATNGPKLSGEDRQAVSGDRRIQVPR